jgi:PIN domain nuclease of toxin-antitoxin system
MTLLDTHAWVWWVTGDRQLGAKARKAIAVARESGDLRVSSISVWEVAMLVRRGRLELTLDVDDWVARSEALPFLRFVPVDNRVAQRAVALPDPAPADPADRMILATARVLGALLVTKDRNMRGVPGIATVW